MIIDLTQRLPPRPRPIETPPRATITPLQLWLALALLLIGALLSLAATRTYGRFRAYSTQEMLRATLFHEQGHYLAWDSAPESPLRVMGSTVLQLPNNPFREAVEELPAAREREAELLLLAAKDDPSDVMRLALLAALHMRHETPATRRLAREELELQLARFGPDSGALNDLAVLRLQDSELQVGEALLRGAYALAPRSPAILHNLAVVARKKGATQDELRFLFQYLLEDHASLWRPVLEARYAVVLASLDGD